MKERPIGSCTFGRAQRRRQSFEAFTKRSSVQLHTGDVHSENDDEGKPELQEKRSLVSDTSFVDEALILELIKRGVSETQGRKLLAGVSEAQHVLDQLEWGDHIIRQSPAGKFYNPPGLYISLVRDNITPPENFPSTRKQILRQDAERAQTMRETFKQQLEAAYERYREEEIDRLSKYTSLARTLRSSNPKTSGVQSAVQTALSTNSRRDLPPRGPH